MAAPLHDLPLLQHDDGIRIAHSGQAVGDHKHGAALHQPVHALFNQGLGAGVDAAGGFVQNQHRRVRNGRPGDGQQLPLPLRKILAVAGDRGVIPLGQASNERVGVGQLGRSHHLLIGGVQLAEADVVRNGAGEQVGVLQHHCQRPAQVRLLDAAHINAVVGDAPVGHVVEPVNQVGYGGLARAGGAHKGNLLAGFCIKADIL